MAMSGDQLGIDIADALGVTDGATINKWKAIGTKIVDEVKNMTINLNTVFTQGVPVPQDGGAALQNAWKVLGAQGGLVE